MFFRKKPKQPLKDAISLADQAIEIAYTYLRDKRFQPTRAELALFEQFRDKLLKHHETVYFIARRLGQRFRGEAEGPKKFTDPEVFDYHYPDLDKILRSKKRVNLHAREKDGIKGPGPKGF